MEQIVILDYSSGVVHIGFITEDTSPQEYMKNHNFIEDNCYFMVSQSLTIEFNNDSTRS